MKKYLIIAGIFFSVSFLSAQNTIKLMSYNLLHYPSGTNLDRKGDLRYIIDTYEPDIFMVCELESETGSDEILNYCLNDTGNNYAAATFRYNGSSNYQDLQQMLYYNKYKFELIYETSLLTQIRDINHYVLKLLSQESDTNPVIIDVYVAHLKASGGSNNEAERLDMVNQFTNDLQNIPQGHFVIFAGDFNFYSSSEPGYQELTDSSNAIVMIDPTNRPGSWHNNYDFRDIQTQATHSQSGNDYVGGGLDDRFDFIMLSQNMMTDPKLQYLTNTYAAYGNNGNCFNQAINSSACAGTTYDATLRQHLYNMSDHLPVVLSLETNQTLYSQEIYSNDTFHIVNGNIVYNNLIISSENIKKINIEIYDIAGQSVLKKSGYISNTPLNVQVLQTGIYFIHLKAENMHQIIKFVKSS
jgi:endonuclease/exonuclease/phosphatase family metal-dependent hydrolase